MRHRVKKVSQLGRKPDHRALLIRSLATALILHDKIQTTKARAASLQPVIERMIRNTKKKTTDREVIRYLKSELLEEKASKKLATELKKKYQDQASGFTRITPLGLRAGDRAFKVQIELI